MNSKRRTRLLKAHYPVNGTNRCPRCRNWWGKRRAWPCQVWRDEVRRVTPKWFPDQAPAELDVRLPPSGYRTPISGGVW